MPIWKDGAPPAPRSLFRESASAPQTEALHRYRRGSFARALAVVRGLVAARHDRPSLVSKVACEIAAEIIEGLRQPGDDLNSVELSRRYQRSCTPIREALMPLEQEGSSTFRRGAGPARLPWRSTRYAISIVPVPSCSN